MEHITNLEEQVSITIDEPEIVDPDPDSDHEASSRGLMSSGQFGYFTRNGMVKVEETKSEYGIIKRSFLMGMREFGGEPEVVAVHRNCNSGIIGKARIDSFRVFSEAVAKKNGGDANSKFAWYGGSWTEICEIISHGFSRCNRPENSESYGHGVHLSPASFSIGCISTSVPDDNGLRHALLCRVILGNMEPVHAGSEQFQPSSKEFDSGVDCLPAPKKYIVWGAYMNSHILPTCIISFKAPSSIGLQIKLGVSASKSPNSPYMSISNLIATLGKYLDSSKIVSMAKHHTDFRGNKITRYQLIRNLRIIAGDDLLRAVIQCYKDKV